MFDLLGSHCFALSFLLFFVDPFHSRGFGKITNRLAKPCTREMFADIARAKDAYGEND